MAEISTSSVFMDVRRVFARWSIRIPRTFAETFVAEDGYWHAWDARRSVSLTGMVLWDRRGRPAPARLVLRDMPALEGTRVAMPDGLAGSAVANDAIQPAPASRCISGWIVVDGAALVATVTSDDLVWATAVWLSIRHHRVPAREQPAA